MRSSSRPWRTHSSGSVGVVTSSRSSCDGPNRPAILLIGSDVPTGHDLPIRITADQRAYINATIHRLLENMNNAVATGLRQFSNSLDNVLTVQASGGSRMSELDALNTIGTNRDLNYTQSLSDLQDLNYAQAMTDYYQRQTSLQAAQQSFMQIQGMNLFNYLK